MSRPHLSASVTQAQLDEIKLNVSNIKNILNFCVNLTPKERMNIRKMGPKSLFYVEESLSVAKSHPGILPVYFSVSEFEKDVNLSQALQEIFIVLAPLFEMLDDTRVYIGSECIKQADLIYNFVKSSSKSDEALDGLREKLAERFRENGSNRGNPKRKRKSRAKIKKKDSM
jgi:hypothetical protein